MVKKLALSACVLMLPLLVSAAANARPYGPEVQPRDSIVCRDGFQSVEGRSVATPYCEDEALASVARGHRVVNPQQSRRQARGLPVCGRGYQSTGLLRRTIATATEWDRRLARPAEQAV
jgi:hypothetical protein